MLFDCQDADIPEAVRADVCVIGSGPAGLALARALVSSGQTVVLVERGGETPRPPRRDVAFRARSYDGIFNGVAFGFGGTSALWGGQLLPMLRDELAVLGAPWDAAGFSEELLVDYGNLESWVGVVSSPYDQSTLAARPHALNGVKWGQFVPLFSKWIPFRRRNLGSAWKKRLLRDAGLTVLLNAWPSEWHLGQAGDIQAIRGVTCSTPSGRSVDVVAEQFVVAAGALDSPLIVQQMLGEHRAEELGVGRALHDHLSIRIAEIKGFQRKELEPLLSPYFDGETMRSLRLCMPNDGNPLGGAPNWGYCHFVFEAPIDSGFAVARDVLRGLQAKDYAAVARAVVRLPSAVGDLTRMVWMRFAKGRLGLSRGSRVFVNADFVQLPSADNWILAKTEADRDWIEIDWDIRDDIAHQVKRTLAALTDFWEINDLRRTGKLEPVAFEDDPEHYLSNLYDIYHPAGTCATGRVVDENLRIHGLSNGYVVGSAVFPMLGRSNPTLTIMALSLRLARHLAALLRNGNQDDAAASI